MTSYIEQVFGKSRENTGIGKLLGKYQRQGWMLEYIHIQTRYK